MNSLLIISHTEHFYSADKKIIGWEPTVREINSFTKIFDKIYHIAPLLKDYGHNATTYYNSDKIKFIPIKQTGGKGFLNKIQVLVYMPRLLYIIIKTIKNAKSIHLRLPANFGLFVLPLLVLYKEKKNMDKVCWKLETKKYSYTRHMQRSTSIKYFFWWKNKKNKKSCKKKP